MAFDNTPNSTIAGTLATLNNITLMRDGLEPLEKDTIFMQFMKKDTHGQQKGRKVMWYRPVNFSEPTAPTPTNEISVGSSLAYRNLTIPATLAVYDDWASLSTQAKEFDQANTPTDMTKRLAYYAALLFDNATRLGVDFFATGLNRAPLSTYARVRDFSAARTRLMQNSVRGLDQLGGLYGVVIAPLMEYDIEFDPEIGSPNDLFKRSDNLRDSILTSIPKRSGGKLMEHGGVAYFTSTNVYSYTSGSTTYYRAYMFANEGFGTVELSGKALRMSSSEDARQRFKVYSQMVDSPSLVDPTNKIGFFCSFRGHHCIQNLMLTDNVNRAVTWDFQSSIA